MKRIVPYIFFAIVSLVGGREGDAQGITVNLHDSSPPPQDYALSLAETTRMALTYNFDIQLAKYDTWISRTGRMAAESVYDTVIDVLVSYEDDQSARSSTLLGTKNIENNYNLGISRKLPTGTRVGIDFDNNRSWSDSSFATINPSHDSSLSLTVEQELGKNFFGLQDRGRIKVTQKEIENAEFILLEKIEMSLAEVQKAYWDLVLQTERVRIEQQMLEHARELRDNNKEKIRHGLVEEPDLLASEANYKQRQNDYQSALDQQRSAEFVLRLLLNFTDLSYQVTAKDPFDTSLGFDEGSQALARAFTNRRDYQAIRAMVAAKDIQLTIQQNDMWPQINLKATMTRNGVDDHFNQAIEKITHENNPDLYTEVNVEMPFENHQSRAELKAAEYDKAKAIVALKQLERRIMINVLDQVRHCHIAKELAQNAVEIADLQARKLAAEEKRFQAGRSNTDTLIRYQDDAVQAQWRAAQAMHRLHVAVVELQKREGSLLDQYWDGAI